MEVFMKKITKIIVFLSFFFQIQIIFAGQEENIANPELKVMKKSPDSTIKRIKLGEVRTYATSLMIDNEGKRIWSRCEKTISLNLSQVLLFLILSISMIK